MDQLFSPDSKGIEPVYIMSETIPQELMCPSCSLVDINPYTCSSGHTHCLGCFNNKTGNSTSGFTGICPSCPNPSPPSVLMADMKLLTSQERAQLATALDALTAREHSLEQAFHHRTPREDPWSLSGNFGVGASSSSSGGETLQQAAGSQSRRGQSSDFSSNSAALNFERYCTGPSSLREPWGQSDMVQRFKKARTHKATSLATCPDLASSVFTSSSDEGATPVDSSSAVLTGGVNSSSAAALLTGGVDSSSAEHSNSSSNPSHASCPAEATILGETTLFAAVKDVAQGAAREERTNSDGDA